MSTYLPSILPRFLHSKDESAIDSQRPRTLCRTNSLSSLLKLYESPGVRPPSSKMDPSLKIREVRPLRMFEWYKYGFFALSKASDVARDVIVHGVRGPRKKSWGIEMTILTAFMREISQHSHLVNIHVIRFVMGLTGLVPIPSDALVTPLTFRVRQRQLRGFLADCDAQETGMRKLSGEWVVGKQLWQRLQDEWKNRNKQTDGPALHTKHRVILYLHGGAYYLGSAAAQRMISIPLSKYADARVFALNYRLAPETTFPGPLHDAVLAYLRLIEDLSIPPENITLAGDSAGGGLTLALLLYLRDNQYPLPSSAILMSPWVDLTMSCESIDSNSSFDVVPIPAADDHLNPISLYLGDGMAKYLTHPYASPLFGDMTGLPPLLIQAGEAEILRDEITLLAHKATLAGVQVQHELYEDCIHVFQTYPFLEASKRAFTSCREFVNSLANSEHSRSPQSLDSGTEAQLNNEMANGESKVVGGDGIETSGNGDNARRQDAGEVSRTDDTEDDYRSWHSGIETSYLYPGPPASGISTPGLLEPLSSDDVPNLKRFGSTRSIFSLGGSSRPSLPGWPSTQTTRPQRSRANSVLAMSPLDANPPARAPPRKGSIDSVPPSPSLRRKSTSFSHPDITLLVEQWSLDGPANQTKMYRA